MRPQALDLFCGGGGASMGLHRAGFDVIGLDIEPQPHYPFRFVRADALLPPFDLGAFDFIWASPVCKAFSSASAYYRQSVGKVYPNQIAATRALLEASGALYAIENVRGAPIRADVVLDGTMFPDLRVIRRRHFETNFPVPLRLGFNATGHVARHGWSCVVGNGTCSWLYKRGIKTTNAQDRAAMGIDWMPRNRLSQAIPPAYAQHVGAAAIEHIERAAA